MSDVIAAIKGSVIGAALLGTILSFQFLNMTVKQRISAVPTTLAIAAYSADDLAAWFGISKGFLGCLMGLFCMALLKLIFDGIKESSIKVNFSELSQTIISLIQSLRR